MAYILEILGDDIFCTQWTMFNSSLLSLLYLRAPTLLWQWLRGWLSSSSPLSLMLIMFTISKPCALSFSSPFQHLQSFLLMLSKPINVSILLANGSFLTHLLPNLLGPLSSNPQLITVYTSSPSNQCFNTLWWDFCPSPYSLQDGYDVDVIKLNNLFSNFILLDIVRLVKLIS